MLQLSVVAPMKCESCWLLDAGHQVLVLGLIMGFGVVGVIGIMEQKMETLGPFKGLYRGYTRVI